MSSNAFFIEAAANTVSVLSCASAGEWADPNRTVKATKNPAKRCIGALRPCSQAHSRAQIRRWLSMRRQAEAPFRPSQTRLRRAREFAGREHNRLTLRVK